MNYNILTYSIYLPIISVIMIKIGWLLFKNGEIFLLEIFNNNNILVNQINKILLAGFYFTNIGYAIYTIAFWDKIINFQNMINSLTYNLGTIIIGLAILHYNNIFWLTYISKIKFKQ